MQQPPAARTRTLRAVWPEYRRFSAAAHAASAAGKVFIYKALPVRTVREFHGKTLDPFQEQSITFLEQGFSVVVSAPTGSGKTLIAEYAIEESLNKGWISVYTAPIKALSNQKYSEFCALYGDDKIGILTGDVVINPRASILIMTTEVYRNMVLSRDPLVQDVKYLIIDEVHFISDPERGTVWEESLIFSPEHIRYLCLSATIPNAREFADWIESIKGHEVKVVTHHHRPVPLKHMFYDTEVGVVDFPALRKALEHTQYPTYEKAFHKRQRHRSRQQDEGPRHEDLVRELVQGREVPCLYFVFSRHRTQMMAKQLSRKMNLLTPQEQAASATLVREVFQKEGPQINELISTQLLKQALSRGIGFHHAGLLPRQKEVVEKLFAKGLIKVLYATETFAVGINMPAKVVCFDSLWKYDGRSHRFLRTKEYYQLAGRAGRRGMDLVGLAIAVIDRRQVDLGRVAHLIEGDDEPLESQFYLGYNTVLNLILHHKPQEIELLLECSFAHFQKYESGTRSQGVLTKREFERKKTELLHLGFLKGEELTEKGWFAAHIYAHELLVAELFTGNFHERLSPFQLALLTAAIIYEEDRRDVFKGLKNREVGQLIQEVRSHPTASRWLRPQPIISLAGILRMWYRGCQFTELLEATNLLEGDLIRIFRQTIDMMMQVSKATNDQVLKDKLAEATKAIDREFVAVSFS